MIASDVATGDSGWPVVEPAIESVLSSDEGAASDEGVAREEGVWVGTTDIANLTGFLKTRFPIERTQMKLAQ